MFESVESQGSQGSVGRKSASPMLRIAIPAWTVGRRKVVKKAAAPTVTKDELKNLFQIDLKRGSINSRLTDNEHRQLDYNQRLRAALLGDIKSA